MLFKLYKNFYVFFSIWNKNLFDLKCLISNRLKINECTCTNSKLLSMLYTDM
jgi:hypothetical protein